MLKLERMSPDLMSSDPNIGHCAINLQEEPRDLSIKRKLRPVPPPLDLSKRTLEPDQLTGLNNSPRSPFAQKNLPLRKRAYSWSSQPESLGLQIPSNNHLSVIQSTCEAKHQNSNLQANNSSSSSSSLKYELPTPHTPHTPHPHSAIPVITSRFNFGDSVGAMPHSLGVPASQGPLNLSTTSVGALPSSLLSPAPSHPSSSSLNSSREELEPDSMIPEYQMMTSPHTYSRPKITMMDVSSDMHSPNNLSPSHHWPTTVWSVFLSGVQIHFVLGGGQITGASFSEDLGQLERNHHQQYAPHGLHLLKNVFEQSNGSYNHPQFCQLYFRPVGIQQEDIMVIAPLDHPFYVRGKGWCSILADQATDRYNIPCQQLLEGDICLPPYHPETTRTAIPVVTPDLTDAMKRFDFNDDNCDNSLQGSCSAPPSATFPPQTHRSVFLSPPASPSKKTIRPVMSVHGSVLPVHGLATGPPSALPSAPPNEAVPNGPKSRRPMNGFMLFAKHHRLKLIQQYPGKDNRAISVLLGAMWKALPEEDRERFNREARLQAEERKRLDPDCWKRKRSHSTS